MRSFSNITDLLVLVFLLSLSACAPLPQGTLEDSALAYSAYGDSDLLQRYAPVFVVDDPEDDYNRIGTPVATINGEEHIGVDPDRATIYTSVRHFTGAEADYTNLFYRIHFTGVPYGLFPFYLGSGNNVGLMVVVTLNRHNDPVLYTMVHTCGCYLSFIATSYLAEESWMTGWQKGRQIVYSENLPTYLDYSSIDKKVEQLMVVHLRSATHRVKNVWLAAAGEVEKFKMIRAELRPFDALEKLVLPDGGITSFYETEGSRKGYVKGSQKIWERLLISWWSLDWRVGEDKKLGSDLGDGVNFYTSLKPWARDESDLRNFVGFLRYWGWKL